LEQATGLSDTVAQAAAARDSNATFAEQNQRQDGLEILNLCILARLDCATRTLAAARNKWQFGPL